MIVLPKTGGRFGGLFFWMVYKQHDIAIICVDERPLTARRRLPINAVRSTAKCVESGRSAVRYRMPEDDPKAAIDPSHSDDVAFLNCPRSFLTCVATIDPGPSGEDPT